MKRITFKYGIRIDDVCILMSVRANTPRRTVKVVSVGAQQAAGRVVRRCVVADVHNPSRTFRMQFVAGRGWTRCTSKRHSLGGPLFLAKGE